MSGVVPTQPHPYSFMPWFLSKYTDNFIATVCMRNQSHLPNFVMLQLLDHGEKLRKYEPFVNICLRRVMWQMGNNVLEGSWYRYTNIHGVTSMKTWYLKLNTLYRVTNYILGHMLLNKLVCIDYVQAHFTLRIKDKGIWGTLVQHLISFNIVFTVHLV
jgi:hypothetical protein